MFQLKTAAPWPKQDPDSVKRLRALSAAEIQANGWGSPPYHPLCRGQLIPTGTVREVVDEAAAPLFSDVALTKAAAVSPSHRLPRTPTC